MNAPERGTRDLYATQSVAEASSDFCGVEDAVCRHGLNAFWAMRLIFYENG